MRFKTGEKIVCIHKGAWIDLNGKPARCMMPKFNEIVTVRGYGQNSYCVGLSLIEYPIGDGTYIRDIWFEPLISDEQLERELESITQPEMV